MRKGLYWYYITRGMLILAWIGLMILLKARREIVLFGVLLMTGLHLWLPHSGRYVIRDDRPLSPLEHDERERAISLRAASYGFSTLVVLLAAAVIWAGLHSRNTLSVDQVSMIMAIGLITQFVASLWLHRQA
ncbi:MAG: hypothetical protein ACUVR2_03200 [Anaerolineae bacterium]